MLSKVILLIVLLCVSNFTWCLSYSNLKFSSKLTLANTIEQVVAEQRSKYANITKNSCNIKGFTVNELNKWLYSNEGFRD